MKVVSAREAGCTLAHIPRVETITVGKARWWVQEVAVHIASAVRKWRAVHAGAHSSH